MRISGILLAAGSGVRMGTDKLLLPVRGRRLLDRAIDALANCALIDEVIVVARPGFSPPAAPPKCRYVVNVRHREGMGTSLGAGIAAADAGAEAFAISLADLPDLTPAIVSSLIEAYAGSGKSILVPVYEQRHGHPVIFGRSWRTNLMQLTGDGGARNLIEGHPDCVKYLPVTDPAVIRDVDTPSDIG